MCKYADLITYGLLLVAVAVWAFKMKRLDKKHWDDCEKFRHKPTPKP